MDHILRIHRNGKDAYVGFHSTAHGGFQDICWIRLENLMQRVLPFLSEMLTDSFFTISSFWRPGNREARNARYLPACFVDVDYHTHPNLADLRPEEIVGKMLAIANDLRIPPSLFCLSGRGVWALWLLCEPNDPNMPPTAHSARQLLHHAIEQELVAKFAALGSDPKVVDVARIMRVPGSVNSKSGLPVQFLWPAKPGERGYMYTMEGLAESLGVTLPKLRGRQTTRVGGYHAGQVAVWSYRLEWLLSVLASRKHFQQGCRNLALLYFVRMLRGVGIAPETITDEAHRLGTRCCKPPLTQQEIQRAIYAGKKISRLRDTTIASGLRITPEEAIRIPRWGTVPDRKELPPPRPTSPTERRALITREIEERCGPASCREMAKIMRVKHGVEVNHVTISRDYKRMGIGVSVNSKPPLLSLLERFHACCTLAGQ